MTAERPLRRLVHVLLYGAVRQRLQRLEVLRTDDVCRVVATHDGQARTFAEPAFEIHQALMDELARLAHADLDAQGTGTGDIDIDADEHGSWRAHVAFGPGSRGEGRAVLDLAHR